MISWILLCSFVVASESSDEKKPSQKRNLPESSFRDRENCGDYFLVDPFFRLPAFTIPVIKDQDLFATLFFRLEGKADSKSTIAHIRSLMPRIFDKIFIDIYTYAGIFWLRENDLDPKEISMVAKNSIKEIFGKNKVKEIFVRDLILTYY